MQKISYQTIDEYIKMFPPNIQEILEIMRKTIREAAPEAEETINYAMPTFKLNKKNLVHFAAYEHHIGFYPTPSGIATFQKEISKYKWAKGSVQFSLDEALPLELIKEIVKFRVKENLEKRK